MKQYNNDKFNIKITLNIQFSLRKDQCSMLDLTNKHLELCCSKNQIDFLMRTLDDLIKTI